MSQQPLSVRTSAGRSTGPRRERQISPDNYAADECELLRALDAYKSANHREYPTPIEIFAIIKSLGYVKAA